MSNAPPADDIVMTGAGNTNPAVPSLAEMVTFNPFVYSDDGEELDIEPLSESEDEEEDVDTCQVAPHTTLTDLPNELLLRTFRHLSLPCTGDIELRNTESNSATWGHLKDLASVCRTCKMFQPLATPLLYQTFPLPDTLMYDNKRRSHIRPTPHLRFMRTLIERPEYRQLVKGVRARTFEKNLKAFSDLYPPPQDELQQDLRDLLAQTTRQYALGPVGKKWRRDICHGSKVGNRFPAAEDAEIALLLCLLNDIRELSVSFLDRDSWDSWDQYRWAVWCMDPKAVSTPENRFHQLEKLSINVSAGEKWPKLSDICSLPMLKSFYGSGAIDYWSDWDTEYTMPNMRHISLHNCDLALHTVEELFRGCPNLQRLELVEFDLAPRFVRLVMGGRRRVTGPRSSLLSLAKALLSLVKTLQVLRIDAPGMDERSRSRETDLLGSFQSFTALQELNISEIALLGSTKHHEMVADTPPIRPDLLELMPPNLESLTLCHCTSLSLDRLERAAGQFKSRLPSLKRITVLVQYERWPERLVRMQQVDRLHTTLNAVGITLTSDLPGYSWSLP